MPFFQGAHSFVLTNPTIHDLTAGGTNVNYNLHHAPPPIANGEVNICRRDSQIEVQVLEKERKPLTGIFFPFYTLYSIFLLRLPNLYLSRMERLGGQAQAAGKAMMAMAVKRHAHNGAEFLNYLSELEYDVCEPNDHYALPVSYLSLAKKWDGFVDSLLEEWKTLNVVSALLVPGILTIFQIPGASDDPITRYLAFWSLVSAVLSLLYGCLFVIQFSQMKKPIVGIDWMTEALEQEGAEQFWAVDVMLALPAIWLAWSILAFIVCIMVYLWRAGPVPPSSFDAPPSMVLGFRIFISTVLGIGVAYMFVIFGTFRRYGVNLDKLVASQIEEHVAQTSGDGQLMTRSNTGGGR